MVALVSFVPHQANNILPGRAHARVVGWGRSSYRIAVTGEVVYTRA